MKRILSTALAIVLFVGAAKAQTTEKGDRRHKGDRKEMAMGNLNLTPEQKRKFESLREAQKKEMQALKNSGNITPEQRKAIHEKYKTQYQAILTPAQQEEMNKQRQEWKGKGQMGKRGQGFGPGGDFGQQAAFFKKELNLTNGQETKLRGIFQEFQSKAQGIRSNNSLNREKKRIGVQALAQQYMTQGKAVLTPAQLKKFDEMKGKRGGKRALNV